MCQMTSSALLVKGNISVKYDNLLLFENITNLAFQLHQYSYVSHVCFYYNVA